MEDGPIRRWRRRAPLWQVFLFCAILFGGFTWLLQPGRPVLEPVIMDVLFSVSMTAWFGYQRRADRRTAGVGDQQLEVVNRAIRTGQVPVEPELRGPLVQMMDRRRGQLGWLRILGLALFTTMLALAVVLVITAGVWPNVLYVVLCVGLDVLYLVWPVRMRRKLDRMAAQLHDATDSTASASTSGPNTPE
jgi:Flp pilus assembly protein TadB